jgi:DNA-binding response OmpR family regulator/predicted Ser/Thr protein kinase
MNDKKDILLINRDREFLENMCGALRQAGHAVHTATDLRQALTTIASKPIGLIVCDHALQDVSGYDFLYYLKSDPLRDSIPFVFLVPLNDQGSASKAFDLGALDFWVYPLDTQELIRRVREISPMHPSPGPSTPGPSTPGPSTEPVESPNQPSAADIQAIMERRSTNRLRINHSIDAEVSRDGIVWLPGQVMNFNNDGIFLRTSLLGKHGLSLKIKFSLPSGVTTVNGEIRNIIFNDFHQPAGIGIKVEQSGEWNQIHNYLKSLMTGEGYGGEEKEAPAGRPRPLAAAKTVVILDPKRPEAPAPALAAASQAQGSDEESFDLRFYQSLVGKQLDNYKAVSFLGAGTMGGVFKGWDIALEREVAIKVISYKLASRETFRDMFIKEARTISKLDHPNIAHIYYIGHTDNILYFVMEFIAGQTLKNLIDKRMNLNTLRGLEYLITVCQALEFVSKKDIIHRDIKPENIMIDANGALKIVDFGVAKKIDSNRNSKEEGIVGSPFYMSPDCIQGKPLDRRSDIYSLGASFYHAFTGFPPFMGKDAEEVLLKHLNEPCAPLNEKNPKVSRSLGSIIEKMMAKDPVGRYQGYDSIIEDLKALRARALKFQQLKNSTLILKPGSIQKLSR